MDIFETKKRIVIKIALLLLFGGGYFFVYLFSPHASFAGQKAFEVAKGDGSRAIGEKLKQENFIRSKWAFVIYVSLLGAASDLKPGVFVFDDSATIPDIAQRLSQGGAKERVLTIPEGWNLYDIGNYLEKNNIVSRAEFLAIATGKNEPAWKGLALKFPFLREAYSGPRSLEGYLFPDTYRVFAGSPAEDIIKRMLENFEKKITPDMYREAASRHTTLFEIVTMASLIEKEAKADKDRAFISGILWKRLSIGMGLQVDATVNYAKQALFNAPPTTRISTEETKIDSPYNTYAYRGLPRGPIANPGLSAIHAALFPRDSN
ncbi:MAG: endolytic transglycosylase MltG, partial [Candidatus Sungbacteria bacterium]|nr:endolytic transglycosylase MltG [Candidatus Sungbacteria bacterium]